MESGPSPCSIHALCEWTESTEQPSTFAPSASNSRERFENSRISVGQTKVKSSG